MSSASQLTANQINAQSSTGPRTEQGKTAASRNALKHGLASAFDVMPNEDQQEFDALVEAYRTEFGFDGEHESFLVEQMAQARWKLARAQRLETVLLERATTHGFAEDWKALAILQRYATAAERSYYRAHSALQQGREQNQKSTAASLTKFIGDYINAPTPGELQNHQPGPSHPPTQPFSPPLTTTDGLIKPNGRSAPSSSGT